MSGKTMQRGFVLVTVLWVLAILTVVALGFGRRALLDARAAAFSLDYSEAMYMARGAVSRGIVELSNKAILDLLNEQGGRTSYAQAWARPVNVLKEGNFFPAGKDKDFDKDICEYRIQDEDSRISINSGSEDLLDGAKLKRSLIRKIMHRRKGGGETNDPIQPFQALEELRYMEGVKDDDWFGTDRRPGYRDMLTCWSDGRINLNTASVEVLKSIPDMRDSVARSIDNYRTGPDGVLGTGDDQDFKSLEQVAEVTGLSGESLAPLQKYCKVDSGFFTITGVATRRQGKVRACCSATVMVGEGMAQIIKWREGDAES